MGFLNSSKSSSSTTNNNEDQRIDLAYSHGSIGVGVGANAIGIDPEVQRINAELLGAMTEASTDGIKTMAGFGTSSMAQIGESATDLMKLSGANTAQAWEHTLDKSSDMFGQIASTAKVQSDGARALAAQAISAANPNQSTNETLVKLGMAAAAALAVFAVFKRKAG